MRKYIAEFIGTFFLVLTVGCTVIPAAAGVIPALAIGAVLMVMIFAGGHISGGHFNPAVTFAVFVRGKLEFKDVVPYWLAQIAAGIVAALVAMFLVGKSGTPMEITKILMSEENVDLVLCGIAEWTDRRFRSYSR